MINKKGFLLGEFTLKLIIAILCIIVLAFLVFKIYATLTGDTDIKKAKGTLERVLEKVRITDEQGTEQSYVLLEPKEWYLVYKPTSASDECLGRECLCVCEKEKECKVNAICEKVSRQIIMDKSIQIDGPIDIVVKKTESGAISIAKR